MWRRSVRETAARAVARRGIRVATGQGARSSSGGRFPEVARKSAQATVRAAMVRLGSNSTVDEVGEMS